MRRKPDPATRRRELCDAAIQLLADDGAKGLSHLKVDRKLGVPEGTTSFYFRTRSALVRGVAQRVAELDLAELIAATHEPPALGDKTASDRPSRLATLVFRSATGAPFARTKARYELMLQANRDPDLAAILQHNSDRFLDLIRDAVVRLHPEGSGADPAVLDDQAYVLMMFISGVMLSFTTNDRTIGSAEHLDRIMSGVVAGVAAASEPSPRPRIRNGRARRIKPHQA